MQVQRLLLVGRGHQVAKAYSPTLIRIQKAVRYYFKAVLIVRRKTCLMAQLSQASIYDLLNTRRQNIQGRVCVLVKLEKLAGTAAEQNPTFEDHIFKAILGETKLGESSKVFLPPFAVFTGFFAMRQRCVLLNRVVMIEVLGALLPHVIRRARPIYDCSECAVSLYLVFNTKILSSQCLVKVRQDM